MRMRAGADTAMRLVRYFNQTPQFWMNLQGRYDLQIAQDKSEREIKRDVQPRNMAVTS